jgi:hypothetical protein
MLKTACAVIATTSPRPGRQPVLRLNRRPDKFVRTLERDFRLPAQHGAWSRLDNCYRDQAVTNARQLADLLTSANVPVAELGA